MSLISREQAARLACVLVDQRQCRELDAERGAHFIKKDAAGRLGIGRPRQPLGDRSHRLELSPPNRDELFSLTGAGPARENLAAVAPAEEENECRQQRDQARREQDPNVTSDRAPVVENGTCDDRGREPDARKHQRHGELAPL